MNRIDFFCPTGSPYLRDEKLERRMVLAARDQMDAMICDDHDDRICTWRTASNDLYAVVLTKCNLATLDESVSVFFLGGDDIRDMERVTDFERLLNAAGLADKCVDLIFDELCELATGGSVPCVRVIDEIRVHNPSWN